jgi:hypothetical protein
MLRYLTAGESHGQALVVIVEGLPSGLEVTAEQVQHELARRRLGYGRGPRQRFEQDEVVLLGGIRHGRTLGSPVASGFVRYTTRRPSTPPTPAVPWRTSLRCCAPCLPASPLTRRYCKSQARPDGRAALAAGCRWRWPRRSKANAL